MLYPSGDNCWVSVVIVGTGGLWVDLTGVFLSLGAHYAAGNCQIGLHSSAFDSGKEGRGTVATVLQWKTLQLSLFLIMTSACNLHATQTKKHANRQGDKIKDNSRPTARLSRADFCWKKKMQVNKLDVDFKLCACHIQQHARRCMNCNCNQSHEFSKKLSCGVIFHQLPPTILLSKMMSIRLAKCNEAGSAACTSATVLCDKSHCMILLHQ